MNMGVKIGIRMLIIKGVYIMHGLLNTGLTIKNSSRTNRKKSLGFFFLNLKSGLFTIYII